MSTQRKIVAIVLLCVFGISVFVMVRLADNSNGAPIEFSDARLQGALISQSIVELSSQAMEELRYIEELDKRNLSDEALQRTTIVVTQGKEIREKAVELSQELDKMTHALPSITSESAREAAFEAVTSWLNMISRLINYSAHLSELMDFLRNELSGISDLNKLENLIEQINADVQAINAFDAKARAAIERFDKLIK